MSIQDAGLRLEVLLRSLCRRPEMADLAPEMDHIYCTLRNHVWFVDHQKRLLDELRQELEAL